MKLAEPVVQDTRGGTVSRGQNQVEVAIIVEVERGQARVVRFGTDKAFCVGPRDEVEA